MARLTRPRKSGGRAIQGTGEKDSGELKPLQESRNAHLQADVEIAKIGINRRDLVKTHFIDDAFDLEKVVSKQSDAPLVGVESGGAGDELADFPGVFAAGAGMAAHQFTAFFKLEHPPIGTDIAVLVHGVKANDRPIGEVGVEAIVVVLLHVRAPFVEPGRVGFGPDFQVLSAGDAGGGILFFFGVFCPFRHGQVAVGGGQQVGAKAEGQLLFKAIRVMEICRDEHKTQVRFG